MTCSSLFILVGWSIETLEVEVLLFYGSFYSEDASQMKKFPSLYHFLEKLLCFLFEMSHLRKSRPFKPNDKQRQAWLRDRTLSASIVAGRYRSAKTASHMAWCLMFDPPKNQEEPLFTIFAFCHVFNKKSRNDPSAKIVTQPLPPSQTFKFDLSPNFCGKVRSDWKPRRHSPASQHGQIFRTFSPL